jgi:hypothetical protein
MDWKIIENDVAYIQIYQFGGSLSSDFGTAVNKIRQSGAKKIILDLRNNPADIWIQPKTLRIFYATRSSCGN